MQWWRRPEVLVVTTFLSLLAGEARAGEYTRYSAPEMFTYEELLELSKDQEFSPELAEKLQIIRTTPFLSNEAYYRGAKPHLPNVEGLGPSLRLRRPRAPTRPPFRSGTWSRATRSSSWPTHARRSPRPPSTPSSSSSARSESRSSAWPTGRTRSTRPAPATQGRFGNLEKSGLRFSRKAFLPS